MELALLITLAIAGIYALYFVITYRIACDHVICHGTENDGQESICPGRG